MQVRPWRRHGVDKLLLRVAEWERLVLIGSKRGSTVRTRAVVVLALMMLSVACSSASRGDTRPSSPTAWVPSSSGTVGSASPSLPAASDGGPTKRPSTVRLVAAGDIACSPERNADPARHGEETGCQQKATSLLIGAFDPAVVMPLGDTQYHRSTYDNYLSSYGPTWGKYRRITRPVIGNHEYLVPAAQGYFRYFGAAAGNPHRGYYSFDAGAWHVVVLNSECAFVGGCGAGSPQESWLRSDLAANRTKCTLAAWHAPRWSSGDHGPHPELDALWRDLYAAGVEILLTGHDHSYERFAPLGRTGKVDDVRGIRQFVVGTGGVGLRPFESSAYGSEVRQNTSFGVLALTLRPDSYKWRFVPTDSGFSDAGGGECH